MAGRDKRARATGRLGTTRGERYALVPEEVMESVAYSAQPDWARSVLFALACRFHGHNNGDLSLPFSEARRLGISAQWKLYAGLRLLERAELIVCARRGMLIAGRKQPTLYGLTWRPINQVAGIAYDFGIVPAKEPTHAWARWSVPDDWRSAVREVARRNHGSSKSKPWPSTEKSSTTTLGNGRSTVLGATPLNNAGEQARTNRPHLAPTVVDTSKTSEGAAA